MRRNFIILFYFVIVTLYSQAQNQLIVTNLAQNQIPSQIEYKGTVLNAVKWTDKSGENYVVLTDTIKETPSDYIEDEYADTKEIFAYHYVLSNDSMLKLWRVYDYVSKCDYDITVSFFMNAFRITDLNNDSIAEVWLMYKLACRSDVSPATMKIIMHQGKEKYAMRGENKAIYGKDEKGNVLFNGGNFKADTALQKNKIFYNYALKLWNENLIENWEN